MAISRRANAGSNDPPPFMRKNTLGSVWDKYSAVHSFSHGPAPQIQLSSSTSISILNSITAGSSFVYLDGAFAAAAAADFAFGRPLTVLWRTKRGLTLFNFFGLRLRPSPLKELDRPSLGSPSLSSSAMALPTPSSYMSAGSHSSMLTTLRVMRTTPNGLRRAQRGKE